MEAENISQIVCPNCGKKHFPEITMTIEVYEVLKKRGYLPCMSNKSVKSIT